MFCKNKILAFLFLIIILLPSCSILKKDCDCPSFSKINNFAVKQSIGDTLIL